jgi:hypothetical protein
MKKIISFAFVLAVMLAAILVFAKISSKTANFKQAEDFPREALIYIQIRDLPAAFRLWNESEIRRKYLESGNFDDFEGSHLTFKILERANEFEEALNIFPDLSFISGLSENKAALAVYDVGKMEFVFIAPMSEEKILATSLFQMRSDFEEIKLDEQTTVLSKEIEVDRGRQTQKIFFTNFRGRLILATSEKYFLQTLDNIRGKTPENRLSSQPLFHELAEKMTPNLGTVWLNQQKLNGDWYFKHYWLMSETENLKNLRAGMLDFEIQDKKVLERRIFLTTGNNFGEKINGAAADRAAGSIPENVPFYKIENAAKSDFDAAVSDVLFDSSKNSETTKNPRSNRDYYFSDWEKSDNYSYLDNDFGEQIDESEEHDENLSGANAAVKGDDLTKIIGAANPGVSVKLFSPQTESAPLFFDNRKAVIFSMQNPGGLNRRKLETALSKRAQEIFTVNNQPNSFGWTNLAVGDFTARRMPLPSLGWQILYAERQNELIFSNSEELLTEILAAKGSSKSREPFDKLTVINLGKARETFFGVFQTLESDDNSSSNSNGTQFFTKNVGSLFDVLSDVEKIEIRQTSAPNLLFEEIDFVFKEKRE